MNKPDFITKNDWVLLSEKYPNEIDKIVRKINRGYPIQYLIGSVDFFGCKILVSKDVLVPRFETELFVDIIIKKINQLFINPQIKIIDLGTGSGCIAIKLKDTFNLAEVIAIDKSKKALKVAKQNSDLNKTNIIFKHQTFKQIKEQNIDVIVSNPPYIGLFDEVDPNVRKFEPKNALFALNKGMFYYNQILKKSQKIINEKFLICFEIGHKQAQNITNLANRYFPTSTIEVIQDYNGKDRFVFITNISQ